MAITTATDSGPDAAAAIVPTPDAETPPPGCTSDVECKGQRICVMRTCTDRPVQPAVDAGIDLPATDQPDVGTMAIDAGFDVVATESADVVTMATDTGSDVVAIDQFDAGIPNNDIGDTGAYDAWFMPVPLMTDGGTWANVPPQPCATFTYCKCAGSFNETVLPGTLYVTTMSNCVDTAPAPIHCAGQADGGAPGYVDPPVQWTYDVGYESNFIAVETETVTLDSKIYANRDTEVVQCVIDMLSDTPQCPVSIQAASLGAETLVFAYNPVSNVVYVSQGSLSWTPRCN